ncbi:hypothetical protein BUY18_11160 [Staphylococcus cohnii]|uniref:class I SAM-dependent methyltransferase n=1 Tax=Staphylococcus ureilyticus TaxID=94138 RepID=UPI000D1C8BFF|nr:class I SAM-dependent methyltransferase [Staphylococcus ureilyticus]MBM9448527.1 methyltransferase domain-containing protein [Staphylococcus ureilyticus]PTF44897.1 hypothetical protein BUY18_11160 [Staphylococcus cohnii]
MKKLFNLLETETPFYSTNNIWNEPKFSNFVLETHLNKDWGGGSKDINLIKKDVKFISSTFPLSDGYCNVLDLGCGPGLYSNIMAQLGYTVTGVDISEQSIKYAKECASDKDIANVNYICNDFFEFEESKKYNLILLNYQIFGTFSEKERNALLSKIYNHLEENGILIFDILTLNAYEKFEEQQLWSFSKSNNIISKEKFLAFIASKKYNNNITLQKTTYLFENGETYDFCDWNKYFSLEEIEIELKKLGFEIRSIYADINGTEYRNEDDTLVIFSQKRKAKL